MKEQPNPYNVLCRIMPDVYQVQQVCDFIVLSDQPPTNIYRPQMGCEPAKLVSGDKELEVNVCCNRITEFRICCQMLRWIARQDIANPSLEFSMINRGLGVYAAE